MSLGHGSKIVTDGLQFAYDMASKHSWKGKPTTNLYTDGDYEASYLHPVRNGPWSQPDDVRDPNGNKVVRVDQDGTTSYNGRDITVTIGQTYTSSCWIYVSPDADTTTVHLRGEQGFGSHGVYNMSNKGTWQYVTATASATTTNARILTYQLSNMTTGYCLFGSVQFELNNFASPFVNGTRSASEALLDWKGGNTLSLTTTSRINHIDATEFEYVQNGTSSATTTTIPGSNTQTQYTRMVWFKPTVVGSNKYIMLNSIGNNADMCIHINNSKASFHSYTNTGTGGTTSGDFSVDGTTTLVVGQVYCAAIVVDRTLTTNNIKVYLDGELETTGSREIGNASSTAVRFATGASYLSGRDFAGTIYAAYHYDRLLSDLEIKQNFNALRGRFGI